MGTVSSSKKYGKGLWEVLGSSPNVKKNYFYINVNRKLQNCMVLLTLENAILTQEIVIFDINPANHPMIMDPDCIHLVSAPFCC